MISEKKTRKDRRHSRVKAKIVSSKRKPRLSVFRSNRHIYAQIVDDKKQVTLLSASDSDKEFKRGRGKAKVEIAKGVGVLLAKRAEEMKIKEVTFDRGGFQYAGRVKALAEGAREGGLKI